MDGNKGKRMDSEVEDTIGKGGGEKQKKGGKDFMVLAEKDAEKSGGRSSETAISEETEA